MTYYEAIRALNEIGGMIVFRTGIDQPVLALPVSERTAGALPATSARIPAIGRRRWVPRGPQEGLLKRPRNSALNGILGLREERPTCSAWLAVAAMTAGCPQQRVNMPTGGGSPPLKSNKSGQYPSRIKENQA